MPQAANLAALTYKNTVVLKGYLDRVNFAGYRINAYAKGRYSPGVNNVATCDMRLNKRAVRNNNAFAGGNYSLGGLFDFKKQKR